jgi:hypothetical protein
MRFKKFVSVEEYFVAQKHPINRIFNRYGLRPIASATDRPLAEVRAALPRLGYELVTNAHGIEEWVKKQKETQKTKSDSIM